MSRTGSRRRGRRARTQDRGDHGGQGQGPSHTCISSKTRRNGTGTSILPTATKAGLATVLHRCQLAPVTRPASRGRRCGTCRRRRARLGYARPCGWTIRGSEEDGLAERYDAVIIGGGHNGLVSAAYLARAGMKTLVLEQRHVLGGAAVTEELFPGFRFSVFSYVVSLLRPEIIRDLELPRHGLDILPLDGTFTPLRTGPRARSGRRGRRDGRLPVAGQRPRPDDPRAPPLVGDRRRGLRGIRPADGRDGPVHQADPGDHAAGPDLARPAAAPAARRAAPVASSSCPSASRPSSSS